MVVVLPIDVAYSLIRYGNPTYGLSHLTTTDRSFIVT
jgi:hypothetical protein